MDSVKSWANREPGRKEGLTHSNLNLSWLFLKTLQTNASQAPLPPPLGEGHSDTTLRRSRMRGGKLTSVDCLLDDSSHLPPEHRAQELDD